MDRVIFCGSVVRNDFPFDTAEKQFVEPLLNEVGTSDFLPALAASAGWGYGSVGSNGLNHPLVETRWHHGFTHSKFLTEPFCNEFWVPFLLGDKPRTQAIKLSEFSRLCARPAGKGREREPCQSQKSKKWSPLPGWLCSKSAYVAEQEFS